MFTVSLLALGAACDDMPQRHAITPELDGRLRKSGRPVAEASLLVVLRPVADTQGRACALDVRSTSTDSTGSFLARPLRTWMRLETSEQAERSGEQFELCVRGKGVDEYQPIFRSAANRWDRMHLDCDLDRDWLSPDPHGSEGRCVVVRVVLDEQHVAQRARRPPTLKCDTTTTALEPRSVGSVKLWANIAELQRLCGSVRDTVFVDFFLDDAGQVQVGHVLDVAGQPILFRDYGDIVRDIVVISPTFRTSDGFGVGTPVARLLDKPDLKLASNGEPGEPGAFYFAWHGEECGIGYAIQPPAGVRGRPGGMIPTSEIRSWPETMSVNRVYIGYCPTREFLKFHPKSEQ